MVKNSILDCKKSIIKYSDEKLKDNRILINPQYYMNLSCNGNFVHRGFKAFSVLSATRECINQAIQAGIIVSNKIQVYDCARYVNNLTLSKNGVEFRQVSPDTEKMLTELADSVDNGRPSEVLRDKIRNETARLVQGKIQDWGFGERLKAIPLDAVYRDTRQYGESPFKSVPLWHIDFTPDLNNVVQSFTDTWATRFIDKFDQSLSSNDTSNSLKGINVKAMVNVWFPLNGHVKSSTLSVMDTSKNIESIPYTAVRRDGSFFHSQSIKQPLPNQFEDSKAIYLSSLGKGWGIVFNSIKTPHSSIEFPYQIDRDGRQSVEVRVAIAEKI